MPDNAYTMCIYEPCPIKPYLIPRKTQLKNIQRRVHDFNFSIHNIEITTVNFLFLIEYLTGQVPETFRSLLYFSRSNVHVRGFESI